MHRVCIHLVEETDPEYALSFRGSGLEYDLICVAAAAPSPIEGPATAGGISEAIGLRTVGSGAEPPPTRDRPRQRHHLMDFDGQNR